MEEVKNRQKDTEMFYPNKMSIDDFLAQIEGSIEVFRQMMNNVPAYREDKYAEDWMKMYVDFMGM